MNDTLDSLITDSTVNTSAEYTVKYTIHMLSPVISAISIQPVWLMDEYVKIFRIDVWLRPPIAPTIVDAKMILSMKGLVSIRYDISIMGAAF